MNPNPAWTTPKHGEITGSGIINGGQFIDVYDEDSELTRRFWNFDTVEDDKRRKKEISEIEHHIISGGFQA